MEEVAKIHTKNIENLVVTKNYIHVQEALRTLHRHDQKRSLYIISHLKYQKRK